MFWRQAVASRSHFYELFPLFPFICMLWVEGTFELEHLGSPY